MRSSVRIRPPRPSPARAAPGGAESLRGGAHRDRDRLDAVVAHALVVPGRFQWLRVAVGIGGPAGELVIARLGVPIERPASPGELPERRLEARLGPGAVDAHLDALERRPTTPCPAVERLPPRVHGAAAGEVGGDA